MEIVPIHIVETNARYCNRMTIADYAAKPLDNSHIPEFSFSERHTYFPRAFLCAGCELPINEAHGEKNHFYLTNGAGPFCPTCKTTLKIRILRGHGITLAKHEKKPTHYGPMQPPMVCNPRKTEPGETIGPIEENWRKGITYFQKEVEQTGFKDPINSLEGLDHFLARVARLRKIWDDEEKMLISSQERDDATNKVLIEQNKELATTTEFLHTNGFAAFSLSSSPHDENDDDMEAGNISDKDPFGKPTIRGTAYAFGLKSVDEYGRSEYYDADERNLIERRIEWERYALACGMPEKVGLAPMADGTLAIFTDYVYTQEELQRMMFTIMKASGLRTANQLVERRTNRQGENFIGSGVYGLWKGEHVPEQNQDDNLTLSAEELTKPEEFTQGPQELGQHILELDYNLEPLNDPYQVLAEPTETELDETAENGGMYFPLRGGYPQGVERWKSGL